MDNRERSQRAARRSMPGQVVMGIATIAFGLLFLLDNLDIWDFHRAIGFWPAIFIVIGAFKLWDTQSANGRVFGVVLIAIGLTSVLNRLGYIHFNIREMWPLILIAIGAMIIYRAFAGRRQLDQALPGDPEADKVIDVTAILGGFSRRITTQHFRGGEVTAFMGGAELDMRAASLEGEAVINVFAAMGGITIKVPTDWTVILEGTPVMGGFEEKTVMPKEATKRLLIKGYAVMGGVEVRN
jgi:predicted membrane protein